MKFRLAVIIPTYFLMYVVCYYAAFMLRFDFELPQEVVVMFQSTVLPLVVLKFLMSAMTGEWMRSFRYATLPDVCYIAASVTGAAGLFYLANYSQWIMPIPRGVILIDWALSIPLLGLLRIGTRIYTEVILNRFRKPKRTRTLVFGTGREGIEILRTIQSSESQYRIVGLVDDRSHHSKSLIAGVPVYSMKMGWQKLAEKLDVKHILIPGSVSGKHVREIVKAGSQEGMKAHVIPSVHEIVDGRFKLTVRDVTISDLLRRESAQLDIESLSRFIKHRRVLVTGGAGSIGSELCRQLLEFQPDKLTILDQSEFGIFSFGEELQHLCDNSSMLEFVIADVSDRMRMEKVFQEFQPEIVFHAAAYKHVPLMEENVQEAIANNILGTKTVVDMADKNGTKKMVLISTDKAVNPTSVMGATKLISEKYLQAVSGKSKLQGITVRFGNVLNSAGSVVPTFRKQIESGGPITVTHEEMVRFFMTIPEAAQLVLQAGALGSAGSVLVLEMGEPCKIVDLAKDMIALSGMKYPDDIDIVFTGLRPGEKLYEELFYNSEQCTQKIHDKIFCASRETPVYSTVMSQVHQLEASLSGSTHDSKSILWEIVNRHVEQEETVSIPLRHAA